MKIALNTLATVCVLSGIVFFLQGINILPGSFMTGDPQWAINGSILAIVGLGLLVWTTRRK